jgi:hypothetical protein
MRRAGFLPFEIRELSRAKTPDGKNQNLDKICTSIPFEKALESRMAWWRHALAPKSEGGWNYTYKQGAECIKNHYKITRARKKGRTVFSFLRIEYHPPQKIQTKRAFTEAVIQKSKIARDMGQYSSKLRHARAPVLPGRCTLCRGVGELQNISGQRQTCPRCAGTGHMARKRYL